MSKLDIYEELSPAIMKQQHEEKRPFVIKQSASSVRLTSPVSMDQMRQVYGNETVMVSQTLHDNSSMNTTLQAYFSTFNEKAALPYYLHLKLNGRFAKIQESIETSPILYSWFRYLPQPIQPTFIWLIIGPENSGSKLHSDLMNTSAWNLLISGRKKWRFVYEKKDYEYIQNPGSLIVIPPKCPHSVMNLEESIALTENFLNQYNYQEVREYFEMEQMEDWLNIVDKLADQLC